VVAHARDHVREIVVGMGLALLLLMPTKRTPAAWYFPAVARVTSSEPTT
jgi:hypothetical protein